MTRQSIRVAQLTEREREDGSRYIFGNWHDLAIFMNRLPSGEWEMRLSQRKAGALGNLGERHAARADYETRREFETAYEGDPAASVRHRKRAFVHNAAAVSLKREAAQPGWKQQLDRKRAEGIVSLGGRD